MNDVSSIFRTLSSALAGSPLARMVGALTTAFVLGTAIGLERQLRQRTAGLRTNVLVALGAAAFAELGGRLLGADGATRIIAYIVSGIGFIGAGVILKDGTNIRGLNTAATLWCSAAVGSIAGSGLPAEAAALTAFVLGGNTVLRPLVNWIDRRPINAGETEALYKVHAVCAPEEVPLVRDLIDAALEAANYPIRDVEVLSETEGVVELAATLLPTSAETADLDAVIARLEASPAVRSATWSMETTS